MTTATELAMRFARTRRIAELEREYRAEIEPLLKIRAFVFGLVLPKITFYQDGRMEQEWVFQPKLQETLDFVDERLAEIRKRYEAML